MGRQPSQWYVAVVSGTYAVTMGDRGRLVLPAELRARLQLEAGAAVLLLDTADGVVLATREQARRLLRTQLGGASLVEQLLADRRRDPAADEA